MKPAARLPEAEHLLSDIEQIACAASHDLRDPLRMALQHCESLRPMLDIRAGFLLESAQSCIEDVVKRIVVLRSYSHLAQNLEAPVVTPLEDILADALNRNSALVQQKNATIRHDALPPMLCRPRQMGILFVHLIDNALKYNRSTPPSLTITHERVEDKIHICFEDNGIGMEPEYRHLIFSLFRRIDEHSPVPGLGAGLAFCRKVAENHHGTLTMESFPGRGTQMHLRLPYTTVGGMKK